MLWNLLTAGIFGTDYYIKKKINTSEKKDLKEKCLGGRLIVRNCHNHGMMLGILFVILLLIQTILFYLKLWKNGLLKQCNLYFQEFI